MLDRISLMDNYAQLSPFSQAIVDVVAIAYSPLSPQRIFQILAEKRSGLRTDNDTAINPGVLRDYLVNLLEKKLIVKKEGYICRPSVRGEILAAAFEKPSVNRLLAAIREIMPAEITSHRYAYAQDQNQYMLRELSLAIFRGDVREYRRLADLLDDEFQYYTIPNSFYRDVFTKPFRPQWFEDLPVYFQNLALEKVLQEEVVHFRPIDDFLPILENLLDSGAAVNNPLLSNQLLEIYMLRGDFSKVRQLLKEGTPGGELLAWRGMLAFLEGDNDQAIATYALALKHFRKERKKRAIFFQHYNGLFYLLAMLKANNIAFHQEIEKNLRRVTKAELPHQAAFRVVQAVLYSQMNQLMMARNELQHHRLNGLNGLVRMILGLGAHWIFPREKKLRKDNLSTLFERALKHGYKWPAFEMARLLNIWEPRDQRYEKYASELGAELNIPGLLDLIPRMESWERSLRALQTIGKTVNSGALNGEAETRLVWWVDFEKNMITPREQKRKKNGGWTKGRAVALKRLADNDVEGMTAQDEKIASAIQVSYGWYGQQEYYIETGKGFAALAGHPLLFLADNPDVPLELLRADPTLIVEEAQRGFMIRFSIQFDQEGYEIVRETPTRYKLIEVRREHLEILAAMGQQELTIPRAGKKQLLQAIRSISRRITIHSAISGQADEAENLPANSNPLIHLLPWGDGFKLEIFVRPFAEEGPYFHPGAGGVNIFAEIDGKRRQTRRDLHEEQHKARELVNRCPTLINRNTGEWEWQFESPEDCLQVLVELDDLIVKPQIEWPEGERLRISHRASFEQLSLTIQGKNDWFALDGKLTLDEKQVLSMQELLSKVENSRGNFIPLSENQFIALTDRFRKQLDALRIFGELDSDGKLKFHNLAALAISDLTESVKNLQVDSKWEKQLQRMREMEAHQPQLPSTLQAELRPYQLDGYRWLSRLAHWGVGACLADDMGLGKTIQALAVILERAPGGPSLVVAPASVTFNWVNEISRFTPTLNVRQFAGKDRAALLKSLGPFDILITSYGLLQQEAELFQQQNWSTIVLDEAQAIKNMATKRSRAAMKLKGGFRIITTGTPVENHLGELWNLFRFLNPGLLGSLNAFNERFAGPIQKDNNRDVRNQLKKLIRPFILRRLKSEVLEELPPKTEITLKVNMSDDEMSFYEALRQKSLSRITALDGSDGERRFTILAEIMKLRRAACHSRLVLPDSEISSAKLTCFEETVDELLENRHKVLVFSQFVDHLKIIRELVERKGIRYQYLDGSTSVKARKQRVEAFQGGEGDLFLISLRAGGTGLNLTAADYVIHLDPWWNPAVEDQASDRAHRIGQQRPVTIYRLVSGNTIEEKIVKLHGQKRDLADDLLSGTGSSGKVSARELLRLIREG